MLETDLNKLSGAIGSLGIKSDDCILIHSALYRFGRMNFSIDDVFKYLTLVAPDGQIVLPMFTYSYRRDAVFDIKTSKPDKKLGILVSHAFDKLEYRNDCPIFSFGGVGENLESYIKRQSPCCFGPGSVFDRLCDRKAKILSLGVDFNSGISMFMNCEKLANVPYRTDLMLTGKTLKDGNLYDDRAIHFARNERLFPQINIDRREIGAELISKNICNTVEVSRVPIYILDACDFREYITAKLLKNPLCMVKK